MNSQKVINLTKTLVLVLSLIGSETSTACAQDKIWLANGSSFSPHTYTAGPFGSQLYWSDWSTPGPGDDIYFHDGVWRPHAGTVPTGENAPPRTVVFGDMNLMYSNGIVEYPGQDWTVANVNIVRGDFQFALGGQTLFTNQLTLRPYLEGATYPFIVNRDTQDQRKLTVSNGSVIAENGITFVSNRGADSRTELHIVENTLLESKFVDVNNSLLRINGMGSNMSLPRGGRMRIIDSSLIVSEKGSITTTDAYMNVLGPYGSLLVSDATINMKRTGAAERASSVMVIEEGLSTFTNNSEVIIGQFQGDGISMIESGSLLQTSGRWSSTNSSGLIGWRTPGIVTVTGENSRWIQNGVLSVGWLTSGELNVLDGGSVNSLMGVIGRKIGSIGQATVRTASPNRPTRWSVQESFTVGGTAAASGGVGDLLVQNTGALVDVGTSFLVRDGSSVAIEDGGVLRVGYLGEELVADNLSRLSVRAGSLLTINPGAVLRVGSNDLLPPEISSEGLFIAGDGRLNGDGLITASSVFNAGTVAPGNSPGLLTIAGDYTQEASGILEIEISGILSGEYDVLSVFGNTEIEGVVEFHFLDGYVPALGDSFEFLVASGTIGLSQATFSSVGLPSGYRFAINSASNGLSMAVTTVPEPSSTVLACLTVLTIIFPRWRSRATGFQPAPRPETTKNS